jgi:hypothetical protein
MSLLSRGDRRGRDRMVVGFTTTCAISAYLFVWWRLTPLLPIFQLYRGGQIYWWRKPDDPEKTTDLSHVTDKLYHIMLYQTNKSFKNILEKTLSYR